MSSLKALKNLVFTLVLLAPLSNANAVLFTNPDPTILNNDDGAQLFAHGLQTLSIQVANPFAGTFGFYFEGHAGNKVTIFDGADNAYGNTALIDFPSGKVGDVDANVIQSTFTSSTANIGFFLTLNQTTIYTEAGYNPSGLDLVGTFSQIANPTTYLLTFNLPDNGGFTTIAAQIVGPVAKAVPEPGSTWLIAIGLLAIGAFLKRSHA